MRYIFFQRAISPFTYLVARTFSRHSFWLAIGLACAAGSDIASADSPPAPPSASHHFLRPQTALPEPTSPNSNARPADLASAAQSTVISGKWQRLAKPRPPFYPGAMILLTDGTVMVLDQGVNNNGGSQWWRLTPDIRGSYLNGTWSKLTSLPLGYVPEYFTSAVLPDGRVVIEGARYNNETLVTGPPSKATASPGVIYDPLATLADQWTSLPSPPEPAAGFPIYGAGTVLANGTFMIGGDDTKWQFLLNPSACGTSNNRDCWIKTGTCKADKNTGETWTLLPNGNVLTVDADNGTNSEFYVPSKGGWDQPRKPSTIVPLEYTDTDGTHELGPQVLRPDGTVFAAGATGNTAVYDSKTGTWARGPMFPTIRRLQYSAADGPAALLPSGNVLVAASPINQTPTHFFVFDGSTLTMVSDTANSAQLKSFYGFMIVLPTGQVMFNSRLGDIELYTETGGTGTPPAPSNISLTNTTLTPGCGYGLSGTQLNGVSQAASYARGYQAATNYPLVRIETKSNVFKSKHVFYARTFGFSSMSVTPGTVSSANFTVPAGIEIGSATLFAVANGIASPGVSVTIGLPSTCVAKYSRRATPQPPHSPGRAISRRPSRAPSLLQSQLPRRSPLAGE
jgi:hypothetical protein